MLPGDRLGHVDTALSNFSLLFANQQGSLIARQAMPIFPVSKLTDVYHVFNSKTLFRIDDDLVPEGGVAREVKWSTSTTQYVCVGRGLRRFVSDRHQANADAAVKPDRAAARILSARILLKYEQLVAAQFTSTYMTSGTTLSGTTQWSDYNNSNPRSNFKTAQETCLIPPNTAVMNEQVYNTLRIHPQLLEMYKYTSGGILSDQLLAEAMGVQRILVGRAKYDTTSDESATFTAGYIWGKHCTFCYIEQAPQMESPTTGWTFWFQDPEVQNVAPAAGDGLMLPVRTYRDEAASRGGNWYEIDADYVPAVVSPLVAYHFTNAIA